MRKVLLFIVMCSLIAYGLVSAQTYSGAWEIVPCVDYSCGAFGIPLIEFDFCQMQIIDDYPTIQVIPSGEYPGQITGEFTSPTEFSVLLVYTGGCTETYLVEGTFISPTEMSAVFSLSLTGQQCSMSDCVDISWQVTGTRQGTYCCTDRVGDANGLGGDEPTIGDVSVMIDAKFITGTCDGILECLTEADINQTGGTDPDCDNITIGDISALIDYLFITGSSLGLAECL